MAIVVGDELYDDARWVTIRKEIDARNFGAKQARYPYRVLTQDLGKLNLYGEVAEGAVPDEPEFTLYAGVIEFPFRVELNPSRSLLKKWGFEKPRDALVEFSTGVLDVVGVTPKIGDRFDFATEQYELMTHGAAAFVKNTKVPLRIRMAAMKARRIVAT